MRKSSKLRTEQREVSMIDILLLCHNLYRSVYWQFSLSDRDHTCMQRFSHYKEQSTSTYIQVSILYCLTIYDIIVLLYIENIHLAYIPPMCGEVHTHNWTAFVIYVPFLPLIFITYSFRWYNNLGCTEPSYLTILSWTTIAIRDKHHHKQQQNYLLYEEFNMEQYINYHIGYSKFLITDFIWWLIRQNKSVRSTIPLLYNWILYLILHFGFH